MVAMASKSSGRAGNTPLYREGMSVINRGERYVIVRVHRKRRGQERTYAVAHPDGTGGGVVRESDLSLPAAAE